MDLQELYDEMTKLVEDMQAFLDEHENDEEELTQEDAETYDRMDKKLTAIQNKIKRAEKVAKANAYLSQPTATPIFNQPGGNFMEPVPVTHKRGGIFGAEYRKNFLNAIRHNFKADTQNYLREASLPDGGYLVPAEWHDEIISDLAEENILRKIGKVITTASEHKVNIVASKPAAAWVSEGQEISFSDETFSQVSLNAYKLACALKISTELLADSQYNLEQHILDEFSKSFARAEENAMLNGTGTNQPKGILTTLAESATGFLQTTGTEISADDLLSLQYSVDRIYRGKACFLASDAALAQIRRLKDADGRFIWEPSLVAEEPARLFGQPIHTSAFLPAPAAGNCCVLFGDFADYFLIGERGQREFQPLRELYALQGQVAFLMTERIDCAVLNRNAIRGLKIRA